MRRRVTATPRRTDARRERASQTTSNSATARCAHVRGGRSPRLSDSRQERACETTNTARRRQCEHVRGGRSLDGATCGGNGRARRRATARRRPCARGVTAAPSTVRRTGEQRASRGERARRCARVRGGRVLDGVTCGRTTGVTRRGSATVCARAWRPPPRLSDVRENNGRHEERERDGAPAARSTRASACDNTRPTRLRA